MTRAEIDALKKRLDIRLNDYLSEMRPKYGNSIDGFNEARAVINKLFVEIAITADEEYEMGEGGPYPPSN